MNFELTGATTTDWEAAVGRWDALRMRWVRRQAPGVSPTNRLKRFVRWD